MAALDAVVRKVGPEPRSAEERLKSLEARATAAERRLDSLEGLLQRTIGEARRAKRESSRPQESQD